MRISIFGLGYVGAVSAGCLASDGHEVIGVDTNPTKVDLVREGKSPIIEAGIGALIGEAVAAGRLRATTDATRAMAESELSLVCVGTPSREGGGQELRYVRGVCEEIGAALAGKQTYHVVAVRSTLLPGTMRGLVLPALEEHSGLRCGQDFGLCHNPEFMREGTAVDDYRSPSRTVIGQFDQEAGDRLAALFATIEAPLVRTDPETAEMIKFVDNSWHALKVSFANEVGSLSRAMDLDGRKVMAAFCLDRKLNLSAAYLRPGFSFGGSCLPKDVRALSHAARSRDLELPLLGSILRSNELHLERGLKLIMAQGRKRVGVLGVSFKAGTDDLRESPMVELVERLLGKGYDIRIYDQNVRLAGLTGANRRYILERIPHISGLIVDELDDLLSHAELIVVGNADPAFRGLEQRLDANQRLLDLVGISERRSGEVAYDGICW